MAALRLAEQWVDGLPRRPYCSNDLADGTRIRGRDVARGCRYIQPNPPGIVRALIFDVDRVGGAFAWRDADLPPPFAALVSPSGHGQVIYLLSTPVCTTPAARVAPLRYASAIETAMRQRLGGDPGYSSNLVHNPEHQHWKVWQPRHVVQYGLSELAEHVNLNRLLAANDPVDQAAGLGRNVTLFDLLRAWAYSSISHYWGPGGYDSWCAAVLQHALRLNVFPVPLPLSEVRATSRSVAKWTWQHLSPVGRQALIQRTHTSEQQAKRGRIGGIASGRSRRAGSIEEAKPWEKAGVSRRTWYRHYKMALEAYIR